MYTEDQPSTLQVAMYTKSVIAQRQLLKLSRSEKFKFAFTEILSFNQNLDEDIWRKLYDGAEDGVAQSRLLHAAPTVALAREILAVRDPNVMHTALDQGIVNMDDDLFNQLLRVIELPELRGFRSIPAVALEYKDLKPSYAKKLAKVILKRGFDPSDPIQDIDAYARAVALLVARYNLLTDRQILKATNYEDFPERTLVQILDFRPSLLPLLEKADSYQASFAVAYCRYLTVPQAKKLAAKVDLGPTFKIPKRLGENTYLTEQDRIDTTRFALIKALVANPFLPAEVRLGVGEPFISNYTRSSNLALTHLRNALTGCRKRLAKGFSHLNPDWSKNSTAEIASTWGDPTPWPYPTLAATYPTFDNNPFNLDVDEGVMQESREILAVTDELDALGDEAWNIFLSMLDDWKGETSDLLQVVKSTLLR